MPGLLVNNDREVRVPRAEHDVLRIEARIAITEPVVWTDCPHIVDMKVVRMIRLPDQFQCLGSKAKFVKMIPGGPFPSYVAFGVTS